MNDEEAVPDLTLEQAWQMLESDPASMLVDVRTTAEWSFVGVPNIDGLNKELRTVEWTRFPTGQPNEKFVAEASCDLVADQPILLLCRSGARSLAAAKALRSAGFTKTYNVVAGFEGDLDSDAHRHGGWKDHLPWRQG